MAFRRFASIILHLLLAVGLVLPGIAAPAQRANEAAALVSGSSDAMHAACDGMSMPDKAPLKLPAGIRHGCDLAACLGTGCLPALPHLAAFVPEDELPVTQDQPMPPSRLFETPLRPPIA